MRRQVEDFFVIPRELSSEFWKDTLQKNSLSLLVICIMIFGMELFNMARVLFWSESGLGTRNNRIYFSLYCALWLAAALYLMLARLLRGAPRRVRWAIQYGAVEFFLLWHVCLNAYDLTRDSNAEVSIYFTAVLGISVFIQMAPPFALLSHGSAYLLFMALAGSILDSGTRLNLTITAIVALAVSLTSCRHAVTMVSQQREISQMNKRLQALARRDPLTGLLNKPAFQSCVEPYLQQVSSAESGTLLMVDLDNFKAVNDNYGHPCGDFVLKEAAMRLQAAFPDAVGLARIGGDEFAALVFGLDASSLEAAAQLLIQSVAGITWHGQEVGAGCSVGACRFWRSGISYDQLYGVADRALYEAKREGKGQLHLLQLA